MLDEQLSRFERVAEIKMPQLIIPKRRLWQEADGDTARAAYSLLSPMPMDDVMAILLSRPLGLNLLYKSVISRATNYGRSFCVYPTPRGADMFQLNSHTEGNGDVAQIFVSVYDSLDVMRESLIDEMERIRQLNGDEFAGQSLRRLMLNFTS